MLDIPKVGMARSVRKSNVRLDVLADWIEASVLFQAEHLLSASDVVDVLRSDEVFVSQSLAWQTVNDAWAILRVRQHCLGRSCAFKLDKLRIRRLRSWKDSPAQSFCVLLSCLKWYRSWSKQFGKE